MIHPNSQASIATITRDGRRENKRAEVRRALQQLGRGTRREIAKFLGYSHPVMISARITEGLNAGELQECDYEKDPETGMKVGVIRLRPAQGEMF